MNMHDYQALVSDTAVFPEDKALEYLTLGLVGEAGEIANKVKKILRGDYVDGSQEAADAYKEIVSEIGDVLWYLAMLTDNLGYSLSDIAIANLDKLQKRKADGVLKGSGDAR